jgi:hypothetical protein
MDEFSPCIGQAKLDGEGQGIGDGLFKRMHEAPAFGAVQYIQQARASADQSLRHRGQQFLRRPGQQHEVVCRVVFPVTDSPKLLDQCKLAAFNAVVAVRFHDSSG